MSELNEKRVATDVLVIGAGGTGSFAAINAHDKGAQVILVNKVPWLGGCTMMGRASYSAAMGSFDLSDSADIHLEDSVKGGGYMGNRQVLRTMCRETIEATRDLIRWGAAFKKNPDGSLDQGSQSMAGHRFPRRVIAQGDYSHIGKVIMDTLQGQIRKRKIKVIDNVMITSLLVSDNRVAGAIGLNWRDGSFIVFNAKSVVMATGGVGRLFKLTDNPTYMTCDGHAAMYRAGAELVDMEFCDFQFGIFHPRKLFGYPPNCGLWLVNGGILLNKDGDRFFKRYFPEYDTEGDCLRTEISRAAACEILNGYGSPNGMVYLNCSNVPRKWMMETRKDMVSVFKRAGIDITWQSLEVAPGLHSFLGGLRIDGTTESSVIKGLFAGGEAAGGWGGANRLGGNAISAAIGLGAAAGKSAAEAGKNIALPRINSKQIRSSWHLIHTLLERNKGIKPRELKRQLQELMQQHVWFQRNANGLRTTLTALEDMKKNALPRLCISEEQKLPRLLALREALEVGNMVHCGQMIATAALARQESRGSHHRSDYPETDNKNWLKNIVIRQEQGRPKAFLHTVAASPVQPPET